METNIKIKSNARYKDLLLKKLSYAVTCTAFAQILLLTGFVFAVNFDPFDPRKWMARSFAILTSVTTWLLAALFLSVIFVQSLLCAKDYVAKASCSLTRIGRLLSMLSARNVALLGLHALGGAFFVWLFLAVSGRKLLAKCQGEDRYCLNAEYLFLAVFGVWAGLYYFVRIYATDKRVVFPVIQQKKLLRFQCNVGSILKGCRNDAVFPVVIYVSVYYFYGKSLEDAVSQVFTKGPNELSTRNVFTLLYAYFFAVLYIFDMKLMRFFFEIFLTEPNEFPIVPINDGYLTLKDAIDMNDVPVLQHLACLDLFLLSTNSKSRRELVFSLSQPGNHPHNWNHLVESVLKILNDYTHSIKNSIASSLSINTDKKPEQVEMPATNQFVKMYNYGNMRNMCLKSFDMPIEYVVVTKEKQADEKLQTLQTKFTNKIKSTVSTVKKRTGIDYLFEELPATNIQFLLSNGQMVVWLVQGLSSLAIASLQEDRFGVVQKDLPVILSTFVELQQALERLNRISALARKSQRLDDYANKMKANINSAVKRSLYHICNKFRPYLKDLPLGGDVSQALQVYVRQ